MEGLVLADAFFDISSYRRSQYLKALYNSIGVNDKSAAILYAGLFIINAIKGSDLTTGIGQHGEGYPSIYHFAQFMLIPHFVGVDTIHTYGQDFNPHIVDTLGIFSNC
ncbi:MAG: hypothetical protein AVO33_07800 [delta proteobacterium ML8_F1]|nr:MAG: hypothetical protein AVO33_07800 [delta proteobacterium ML8_F1]